METAVACCAETPPDGISAIDISTTASALPVAANFTIINPPSTDKTSEFEFEQQTRARAREISQIKWARHTNLMARDLRFPCGAHQHFAVDAPVERRAEIDRVAGEGPKQQPVVVAQIPEVGADRDVGNDLPRQRRRAAGRRFVVPTADIVVRGLGLVE